MSDDYIAITNEDLYKMIPWFTGFIDIGRMQYRLDLTSDELAKEVINYRINKNRKETFTVIEGDKT